MPGRERREARSRSSLPGAGMRKGGRGAADGVALRTIAWRVVLPVLLSMIGKVFPFEHGAAFVTTHSVAAAGQQRRTPASCPLRPVAFARAPVASAGGKTPATAAWPPAWARPHLKLAAGASSLRGSHTSRRAVHASSFRGYTAPAHGRAARPPVVAMRASPAAGTGGFGRGGAGGKRRFTSSRRFVGGGPRKRPWGARPSFPSSSVSKTASLMAKTKASTTAAAGTASALAKKAGTKTKTSGGGYKLVIVESPAKARTIQKFLDSQFVVESCMGHVRDLPQKARDVPAELKGTFGKLLGVDADNGFAALYVTMSGKEPVIKKLKDRLKGASELILASDEDREGEAISWHLLELLKPKVPVKRAVFHEITRDAIIRAFESPRTLNYDLVHAQEARRILDRLAGYTMSPLLWRKISPGLSAGRVQSVGLAMIVRRERERLVFVSADYYDLKANLSTGVGERMFAATLVETDGKLVASGKDFDADGKLKGAAGGANATARGGRLTWLGREEAEALKDRLEAPGTSWSVTRVESKQQRRRPPVPFITSTLQQEANRKLSMSSKECMRVAQGLYEAGWITYMRTDNPVLSEAGRLQARQCVSERYGPETLGPEQRAIKKPLGSQEAHEPIRPAITEEGSEGAGSFNMNPPLQGQQLRLYEMILQRTLASVMVDAVLHLTTADVAARTQQTAADAAADALFRASGVVVKDPGWMRAYQEGNDGAGGAAAGGGAGGAGASAAGVGLGGEKELPALVEGQAVGCEDIKSLSHR